MGGGYIDSLGVLVEHIVYIYIYNCGVIVIRGWSHDDNACWKSKLVASSIARGIIV